LTVKSLADGAVGSRSDQMAGTVKLLIEAPVNGGRNYNGPKVAKFLVG